MFRQKEAVTVIADYLEKTDKLYFQSQGRHGTPRKGDQLLIGRMEHACRRPSETVTEDSEAGNPSVQSPQRQETREKGEKDSPGMMGNREAEECIRRKAAERLNEAIERQPGLQRSESVVFMQRMVQNASLSALIEFYDIDEMFQ